MRAEAKAALLGLLLVWPALAEDAPPIELGSIPRFSDEAGARCPGDVVVWADRDNGYFYPKARPEYGTTKAGAYTCLKAALGAKYWDINPFSELGTSTPGREFPIDPSLLPRGS